MTYKQLAFTGITAALILSNCIIGDQYIHDSKIYESKIKDQNKVIKQINKVNLKNKQEIKQKTNQINDQQNQIDNQSSQINQLNDQLNQVKQENDSLKKQLEVRKEVDNKPKLNIQASAYTSNCSGCTGNTYTGYNVSNTIQYNGYRIIAADLSVIPLYSIVRIDTNTISFEAIVLDTGGAIKGKKVDLLVNTYKEAMIFGRQDVTITILREGRG